MRYSLRNLAGWLVNFFVAVVLALLLLRVVLRFFNGNPDATFINWVYTNTNTLLEPFRAVYTSAGEVGRGWVVDWVALFAMVVYALVGYLVWALVSGWATGWMARRK